MHRFFLPMLQPNVDEVISLRPIHNQLFRVLRVQPGEEVLLLDNAGNERLLKIESVERRDTTARVLKVRPAPPEPAIAVTLYQCILRSDKFDLVLQKATELGVTTIVPVLSNRTVARMGSAVTPKHTRWNTIVREAAEQSGRGGLPTVAPILSFADAIANASGARVLPWEEAKSKRGLLAALGQAPQPVESVSILIGPEGGLEASEAEQAVAAGWQVVSLGKRILRAETAAMAALTLVALAVGDLGDEAIAPPTPTKSGEAVGKKNTGETPNDAKPAAEEAAPTKANAKAVESDNAGGAKAESAKGESAKTERTKAAPARRTRRTPADVKPTASKRTAIKTSASKTSASRPTDAKDAGAHRNLNVRKGAPKPDAKK